MLKKILAVFTALVTVVGFSAFKPVSVSAAVPEHYHLYTGGEEFVKTQYNYVPGARQHDVVDEYRKVCVYQGCGSVSTRLDNIARVNCSTSESFYEERTVGATRYDVYRTTCRVCKGVISTRTTPCTHGGTGGGTIVSLPLAQD